MEVIFNEFTEHFELKDEAAKTRGFLWKYQGWWVISIDDYTFYKQTMKDAFDLARLILD
jgi:hypothetical protein